MKNYKEIADSVFERKQRYETEKKRKRKMLTLTLTPICCVCLVTLLCFGVWHIGLFGNQPARSAGGDAVLRSNESTADGHVQTSQEKYASSNESPGKDVTVESGNVWIYFADGNEMCREGKNLLLSSEKVFGAWKEKNGIGDEVELIKVNIQSNGKEIISSSATGSTVQYQTGNYFIYSLTVSKEIESYCKEKNSELLLDSLKNTMTGYCAVEFNEYNLILE